MPPVPPIPSSFTLDDLALPLGVVFAAALAYLLARRLLTSFGASLVRRANPGLAAALERERFFAALALVAPALVVGLATPLLQARFWWAQGLFPELLRSYVVLVLALAVHTLLRVSEALLTARQGPNTPWLHGLFRWLQVLNVAAGAVLALGVFANVQVTWVLAAIGVVVATGSIVFSDMIYNAIAQTVLRGRGLLAEGDWIELPELRINGAVKHVGPLLVQVQNWDNTLATVSPRYLLNTSFRNWQQMHRVGTRRLLRSVVVDVASIKLLDEDLRRQISALLSWPTQSAQRHEPAAAPWPAAATNVELYRAYLMAYLGAHPQVDTTQILRVTNEDALGQGLPLLLLAYLTETEDVAFRLLEAAIYEHALAVAAQFELRLFQVPTGSDVLARREAMR